MFGSPRTPSYREGRRCSPYRSAVHGRLADDGVLRIRTAGRTVFVNFDAATRFTNRPAYEPVRRGQRLRLATSRCGPRRVADRVTFLGASPAPDRYDRTAGGGRLGFLPWLAGLLVLVAAGGLLVRRRRS